jgi:hypothetical protein
MNLPLDIGQPSSGGCLRSKANRRGDGSVIGDGACNASASDTSTCSGSFRQYRATSRKSKGEQEACEQGCADRELPNHNGYMANNS